MKKQIDPNLNNLDNDILKELTGQAENTQIEKREKKSIDPQLGINISDVISKTDIEKDKASANKQSTDTDIGSITDNITKDSEIVVEHHHHHSEHHHSEHHHHHHDEYDEDEEEKKKKPIPLLLRILLALVAIILIIALIAGSTFYVLTKKGENDIKSSHKIVTQDNEYNETIQYNGKNYVYDDDVVAFAFLGIDQNEFKTAEQTNYVGSADTDLVVAINTKDGKVDVIAIPRDTMVDIDIYNNQGQFLHAENKQLCLAYRFGNGGASSSENVTKAMSRILGVPIEKYFTLDLRGIAPLNDAIGGVTLESKFDFKHDYGLDIHIGDEIDLKGELAQMYIRARGSDNINASLGRTERQIQYIKAYAKQLLPAVKDDFSTISRLYNTAAEYSQTNITLENITYIASILLSKNVTEFRPHTLEGKMRPAPVEMNKEDIYAEYILDETKKTELVLDIFYDEVG